MYSTRYTCYNTRKSRTRSNKYQMKSYFILSSPSKQKFCNVSSIHTLYSPTMLDFQEIAPNLLYCQEARKTKIQDSNTRMLIRCRN